MVLQPLPSEPPLPPPQAAVSLWGSLCWVLLLPIHLPCPRQSPRPLQPCCVCQRRNRLRLPSRSGAAWGCSRVLRGLLASVLPGHISPVLTSPPPHLQKQPNKCKEAKQNPTGSEMTAKWRWPSCSPSHGPGCLQLCDLPPSHPHSVMTRQGENLTRSRTQCPHPQSGQVL